MGRGEHLHGAVTASCSFFIESKRRFMTVSDAPPTFPSPLSSKGTVSMARRYIFFFSFSSSLFLPKRSLPLRQPGASDSGLWYISERCGSSNEELGIWLEDPAAGPGLDAYRRLILALIVCS